MIQFAPGTLRAAVVGLAIAGATFPTPAQEAATTASATAPAAAPKASLTPFVDESALRYYARQGDPRRLEAEIARLRAIYPDWTPPEDPLSNEYKPDDETQRMWDLFATGNYAGVREAIVARRAADGTWQPPLDLLTKLGEGEAAAKIRAATEAGDYDAVVIAAATNPEILNCGRIDLLWDLGEAFVATDRVPRGMDLYGYILRSCADPEDRLATMQKASLLLDRADMEPLLALEKTDESGVGEFLPVKVDLARNAIVAALEDGAPAADPADLEVLAQFAEANGTAEDFRLLGFYELKSDRPRQALAQLQKAYETDDSADTVMGLAIAMVRLGDAAGAEEMLATYRHDSPELEAQYLLAASALLTQTPAPILTPDILGRIAGAVTDARDATTAQNLGWYAFNFDQARTAADWFRVALEFEPETEAAAYGLLVASQQLRDTKTMQR
jgi:tetratricopeptide (TPR) repeat protein